MATVGLIFGGRSVEHAVSVTSARTVAAALEAAGHRVVPLGIGTDGTWVEPAVAAEALAGRRDRLAPSVGSVLSSLARLVDSGVEVVFPITHGTWGEDGTLQGLCEMADLPYVGAGVAASALAMDKLLAKRQLDAVGLPVVPWEATDRLAFEEAPEELLERCERLTLPLFVKPSVGGSSVGVVKVRSRGELEGAVATALHFADRVLVEEGITCGDGPGREIECAVLGGPRLEAAQVLGEIVPGQDFYDYTDKYLQDGARLEAPADLPEEQAEAIRRLAVEAFAALGGEGMARVDFLVDGDGRAFLNEINTLPGFTRISMYPRLWDLSGVPLPQLVDRLVAHAVERRERSRRLDAGIRDWIAGLEES